MNRHRSWVVSLAFFFAVAGESPAAVPGLDAYRDYALSHDGDAARGARLFQDEQRLACIRCHSIDGSAGKAGPDLRAAGDAFTRRELTESVLRPSATIAPGYAT